MITGTGKSEQTEEGVQVLSTATNYSQKMSKGRRILAFGHFMLGSFWKGLTRKKDRHYLRHINSSHRRIGRSTA